MIRPPLTDAQQRCLLELYRRQDWAAPCRSEQTLEVLGRRGLIDTRTRFPGMRLQGRITAAGCRIADELRAGP